VRGQTIIGPMSIGYFRSRFPKLMIDLDHIFHSRKLEIDPRCQAFAGRVFYIRRHVRSPLVDRRSYTADPS
jgi:hypothetical protein